MRDPYQVLGLTKGASTADIKKSYRALAKKYHPDTNKGDEQAAQKFSEISTAHDLLIDEDKRRQFDSGDIDAEGNPTHKGFNPFGGGGRSARWSTQSGGPGGFNPEDIFSEIFGNARRAGGADVNYHLKVTFVEAAQGGRKRVSMPNGKTLDVNIPAGVLDGQQIRLRGQGGSGPPGAPAGDALITIEIGSHPLFERVGSDIRLELPVTLYEAVLGARIRVPTISGSVGLKIPPKSSSGKTLRLKGKGVAAKGKAGDQLVVLRIVLPEDADDAMTSLAEDMAEHRPYTVRGPQFGNNS